MRPARGPRFNAPMLTWRFARLDELTPREVHDLLRARSAVFVVEQDCVFLDADGADVDCWHLLGYRHPSPAPSQGKGEEAPPPAPGEGRGEGRALAAYCRLVPPGVKFPEPSIGRVVTTAAARRTGAGRALMREAVSRAESLWPGAAIRIGAQVYLERFYGEFGFVKASDVYVEDGIPHIEMLRTSGRES